MIGRAVIAAFIAAVAIAAPVSLAAALVFVTQSSGVRFEHNSVVEPGVGMGKVLEVTGTVSGEVGAEGFPRMNPGVIDGRSLWDEGVGWLFYG